MQIKPTSWLRIVGQVQDARAWFQNPPLQPPNTNRLDLKLAYAEVVRSREEVDQRARGPPVDQLQQHHHCEFGMAQSGPFLRRGSHQSARGSFSAGNFRGVGRGSAGRRHQPSSGRQQHLRHVRRDRQPDRADVQPGAVRSVASESQCRRGDSIQAHHRPPKRTSLRHSLEGHGVRNLDYSIEGIREVGRDGPNNIRAWGYHRGASRIGSRGLYWKPRIFGAVRLRIRRQESQRRRTWRVRHHVPHRA